jgi:putative membrane protein
MSQTSDSDSLVRIAIIIAAVVILGPAVLMLLMLPLAGGMMMGVPRGGGFAIVGILMTLLFPLLLIVVGVILYRQWSEREREDEAMRELRMAFARGDIDREEFEERREALVQGERRAGGNQWDEPPAEDRWDASSEDESGSERS